MFKSAIIISILLTICTFSSFSFASEKTCLEEVTGQPYCVGVRTAKRFCSFGDEIVEISIAKYHEFIEVGKSELDSSAIVFMGFSTDVIDECK